MDEGLQVVLMVIASLTVAYMVWVGRYLVKGTNGSADVAKNLLTGPTADRTPALEGPPCVTCDGTGRVEDGFYSSGDKICSRCWGTKVEPFDADAAQTVADAQDVRDAAGSPDGADIKGWEAVVCTKCGNSWEAPDRECDCETNPRFGVTGPNYFDVNLLPLKAKCRNLLHLDSKVPLRVECTKEAGHEGVHVGGGYARPAPGDKPGLPGERHHWSGYECSASPGIVLVTNQEQEWIDLLKKQRAKHIVVAHDTSPDPFDLLVDKHLGNLIEKDGIPIGRCIGIAPDYQLVVHLFGRNEVVKMPPGDVG